jgi:hypothetical protein
MPGIGIGLGIGFGRGGVVLPGGTMAAVSSPATFSALGATWTIGDLSPVLWTVADEGITLGAEATIGAVSTWATAAVHRGTDGDWVTVTDNANPNPYAHGIYTAPTDAVVGPLGVDLELRRGSPVPGSTLNRVKIWPLYAAGEALVSLDDGTVTGTYDYAEITPLGETADAGYRVEIGFAAFNGSLETAHVSLVDDAGSVIYTDATGAGYFRIKDAAGVWQQRVASWADCRGGEYADEWAQATEAEQPILWRDSVGSCLAFGGAQRMTCEALADAIDGTSQPAAIVAALRMVTANRYAVAWRNSVSGHCLAMGADSNQDLHILRWNGDSADAILAGSLPFAGSVVARYTGAATAIRASGSAGTPANQTGAAAYDTLTLGCITPTGGSPMVGRVYALALFDAGLSDAEAVAADLVTLRDTGL